MLPHQQELVLELLHLGFCVVDDASAMLTASTRSCQQSNENVDDAVGVDVEGDLHLRNTAGGGWESHQSELTHHLVVSSHLSLPLTHLDLHLSLTVSCCGKHLEGARLIAHYKAEAAASVSTWLFLVGIVVFLLMSLVKTPPRVSIPRDSGVTSSSSTSVTSPAKTPPWMAAPMATASSGLTDLLGARPNRSCTEHLPDVSLGHLSVLHGLLTGSHCASDQVTHDAFKLRAGQLYIQMFGAGGVHGQRRGQLTLGLLSSLPDSLQSHVVFCQIHTRLSLELLDNVSEEVLVEVLSSKEGVSVGRLHLKNPLLDLQDRDIKRTSTQVIDGNTGNGKTVGQSSGCGLVDHTQDVQTSDLTRIFGRRLQPGWGSIVSHEPPARRHRLKHAQSCRGRLVTDWRLAGMPTRRSPSFVKAMTEGVVLAPSAFSNT
ncbi:hypothetical protein F7725_009503 [Dissostichus mawsoni]|uniref:Uncharacterized protein n=1 Tax=Dissostichus mawsoni TaxID=36200 RepID=A0A7J5XKW9_DISMA|nr:hypothetical protein F7725_009503 [Dissostichus mawsoni]